MPDDERTRRRLGDATKAKIADLADGWSTPSAPLPEVQEAEPARGAPTRKKPKTFPPPPPGSRARQTLENEILSAKEATPAPVPVAAPPARSGKVTSPPPMPPAKSGPMTSPVPAIAMAAVSSSSSRSTGTTRPPPTPPAQPPTVIEVAPFGLQRGDDSLGRLVANLQAPEPLAQAPLPPLPAPRSKSATGKVPVVPLGEFDDGKHTLKRDAAEAVLKMPPPTPPKPAAPPPPPPPPLQIASISGSLRGEPTLENQYERGDPTAVNVGNVTQSASLDGPASTLRSGAKLRRKRGVFGDVRYVFTALFGVRRTRAEIAELQTRQDAKQASRRRHLVTLGRTAMLSEYKHAAMDESRVSFETVEDERANHAGQVAAADAELERVRRDREAASKRNANEIASIDADLAALAKKLEPLDKEAATVQRRADQLRDALAKIDAQIASTQNSLISVKGQRIDKAAVEAEVATLRADRQAVQRDEPIIAAELDTLQPRIAALRGQRTTAQTRRTEILLAEEGDKKRIEELLTAIGAKRKVVDRAAAEAEAARDKVLFELGEKLYVDRPKKLAAQLAPIDTIDFELGEGERRIMELREILSNVDKTKIVRGIAVIAGMLLVAGAIAGFILYLALT